MDIGLEDGFVTPTLVPGICEDAEPQSYPAPTLEKFNSSGFSMVFEVEPRELEKDKILKIVYPNGGSKRIQPLVHIPVIMDYIKNKALQKGFAIMPPSKYSRNIARQLLASERQQNQIIYHQP